jgi:single-stranded-DNA-specific exonuclease
LLVAENREKAELIAKTINSYNDERKKLDHEITEEAINKIKNEVAGDEKKATVLYNPEWHKGVVGIVASRLTESFYRPTIILTNSNGYATGSARSVEGFDLYNAISQCSEFLENYGGHKYAAGLTLKLENLEPFKQKFEQIVRETITEEMLTPQISIDAKLRLNDITPDLYHMLQKFAPFGPNNTIPTFMTQDVSFSIGTKRVGRNHEHLKLVVVHDTHPLKDRSGIGFGMGYLCDKVHAANYFDLCYTLQENEFMGKNDIQMMIKDIHFKGEDEE